jgi:hypothetical protein
MKNNRNYELTRSGEGATQDFPPAVKSQNTRTASTGQPRFGSIQ